VLAQFLATLKEISRVFQMHFSMGLSHARVVGLLLALCGANASAESTISHRFSGFATLGVVSNDNPNLVFRRDVTQKDGSVDGELDLRSDSLLGLQWQTQWSDQFETSVQVVLKDRLENSVEEAIEWAFVRYRPLDSLDLRLGRLGADFFMLSDYRQVGYALPWVRPPIETYSLLSLYYFDGIDINKRVDVAEGTLNVKAFFGRSDRQYPVERGGSGYDYRLAFEGYGTSIGWEREAWKLRFSHANVEVQNNNVTPLTAPLIAASAFWPEASSLLARQATKGAHIRYNQLSLAYDNNRWWLQSEISGLNTTAEVISNTRHFYVSAGRRIDRFTLYTATGYMRATRDAARVAMPVGYPEPVNSQLAALAMASQMAINGSRGDQESITLGTRWDFATKMALKLQWDHIKVNKDGSALWLKVDTAQPNTAETANVVSLSWDLLF
jgi:hypothetical protein